MFTCTLSILPKESHLKAIKQVFNYLYGIIDLGLWYLKNFDLKGYSQVDFVGAEQIGRALVEHVIF